MGDRSTNQRIPFLPERPQHIPVPRQRHALIHELSWAAGAGGVPAVPSRNAELPVPGRRLGAASATDPAAPARPGAAPPSLQHRRVTPARVLGSVRGRFTDNVPNGTCRRNSWGKHVLIVMGNAQGDSGLKCG